MMLTFEEFQGIVTEYWPHASKTGSFKEHQVSQGVYYVYQGDNEAASYDSRDELPWFVQAGLGSGSDGNSFVEAWEADRRQFEEYIRSSLS